MGDVYSKGNQKQLLTSFQQKIEIIEYSKWINSSIKNKPRALKLQMVLIAKNQQITKENVY